MEVSETTFYNFLKKLRHIKRDTFFFSDCSMRGCKELPAAAVLCPRGELPAG